MAAPLLLTKLFIPRPRSELVDRPRLVDRLSKGLAGKLTLISAPAGFGKTTLVSEWLPECGLKAAWLSLDEADNDPNRFLTYLIAALQTIDPAFGQNLLAKLAAQPASSFDSLLPELVNEISSLTEKFLLVLDDYHVIDNPSIDGALAFLIENQPPSLHLVITTREDPNLPLARLRARGQVTELRAADLRLTPAEAADFLNKVMGLDLRREDIDLLEARTEGWIAGLQLAALSLQGQEDAAGFIKSFSGSHRFVLDYLVEEVLQRLPEATQTFLLRTSILDRFCGALCDAVVGDDAGNGQQTLEYLDRANLFIVPLDQERRWFRYHHLFGELLRMRLGQPADLLDCHLRASAWLEADGDYAEALQHAFRAGDFDRAAGLAESAWQGMERSFQSAAWLGWVEKLPQEAVRSRPGLCVQLGWAFSDSGETDESEKRLRYAEQALSMNISSAEPNSFAGSIALIRANNAQNKGDLAETVKFAEQAMRLIPEDNPFLRAQAVITLEFVHWAAGDLEASLRAMRGWIDDMNRLGSHVFAIASAFAEADMLVTLGRLGEAERALHTGLRQAADAGADAEAVTAHHHLGLAMLTHERGDENAFGQHLKAASDLGKRTTLVDWPYRLALARARLHESAGEWDSALACLDEAGRTYVKNPIPLLAPVGSRKVRIFLKQGRLDKARAWAMEREGLIEGEARYRDEYDALTLARVRLAEGRFDGLDGLFGRLLILAERQKRVNSLIEILLTQALASDAQGKRPEACAVLLRALALAQPEGYLRVFLDEGETLRPLLADIPKIPSTLTGAENRRLQAYAARLLSEFERPVNVLLPGATLPQESALIEALTAREIEILRLVAEGHGNAEIGRRLYLAVSTIKGHNQRIFDKLQVQNRTEAVARARELGLI